MTKPTDDKTSRYLEAVDIASEELFGDGCAFDLTNWLELREKRNADTDTIVERVRKKLEGEPDELSSS